MIETKRLLIRKFESKDFKRLYNLDSNPLVHKYLYNSPMKSYAEAKVYIQAQLNQYENYGVGRLAVLDKKNNFLGWAGLKFSDSMINNKTNFYDLGYRLKPNQWGKGIATEASKAILDYYKNLKNICGIASVENIASNKVLIKSGLVYV
ncbi:GNAT family N-acetyltransferase, partial [Flavobacteriaceae bacterium]|nr:GNAT family N-acetyltransferase [Flavobacteriaceae bacterium]